MGYETEGWWDSATQIVSPNQDDRPGTCHPELIVLHNISLPPGEFGGPHIEAFFTNSLQPHQHPFFEKIANLKVSAHFLIRRDGRLLQFVSTDKRAWHAGASKWISLRAPPPVNQRC